MNADASSGDMRREGADRSSLSGKAGRWREDMDIAEGLRPGREDEGDRLVGVGAMLLDVSDDVGG